VKGALEYAADEHGRQAPAIAAGRVDIACGIDVTRGGGGLGGIPNQLGCGLVWWPAREGIVAVHENLLREEAHWFATLGHEKADTQSSPMEESTK
jgi:hypothetical protein